MSRRSAEPRRVGLRRVRLIALREFRERVGQRAYLIAVVVGAVVAAGAVVLPSVIDDDATASDPAEVAIVFEAPGGVASDRLEALRAAARTVRGAPIAFKLKRDVGALRTAVREGEDPIGLIVLGSPTRPAIRFVTREGGSDLTDRVGAIVDRAAQQRRLEEVAADAGRVFDPVPATGEVVQGGGPTGATAAVVGVLGFVLYIAGIMLTTAYATGIVSDRTNHVTERLLTAARPSEHLAGKLIGVGAAGLLQFGAWIAAALIADGVAGSGTALDDVPSELLAFFPVSLVLTYVLYAAAATLLVLPVRKAEDVGGALAPAVMLQIVAFIATTTIIAPGATVSGTIEALSLVPFFAPLLMLGRLAGGDVAVWEVGVGIVGPLLMAALLLKLAAPAYARTAIDAPGGKGLKATFALLRGA